MKSSPHFGVFMRIIFKIFLYFFISGNLKAQPIIYSSDYFQLGDNIIKTSIRKNDFKKYISRPDSGSNMLWDYSYILSIDSLIIDRDTVSFTSPETTPFYYDTLVDYKRANFCMVEDFDVPAGTQGNSEYYFYYSIDQNKLDMIGKWEDSELNEVYWFNYIDPRRELVFPLQFGTTFKDTFVATYYDASSGMSITRKGSVLLDADSYGTLITPDKDTFYNVLKVTKLIMTALKDNYTPGSRLVEYSWYSKERKGSVMLLYEQFEGFIYSMIYYTGKRISEVAKSVTVNEIVSIYPNPITSFAYIKLPQTDKNYDIDIYNILGKVVRSYKNITVKTLSFRREELPGGIYFAQVLTDNKPLTVKKILILK